jgi:pimeloyl-ACP methyl ester carboxylesterase
MVGRSDAMNETPFQNASHIVLSKDGTNISYLSVGAGPSVIVIPGVLSMAADYAAFARALSEHFSVHTIERRGRGESGPQGDDYSIVKECEDVLALQAKTGASFDGSMPRKWMPGYEKKLAEKKNVDALVEFTLADAPPRIQRMPPWLMKLLLLVLVSYSRQYRQMLGLLHQNLREWREIARLDSSCENYREVAGGVLLMYGGKSDSKAVTLAMERLAAILPRSQTKEFPRLDHFGIERTAPREVAKAVTDYFLK